MGLDVAREPPHGRLAQLVEHLVYTERVGGSSPSPPTTTTTTTTMMTTTTTTVTAYYQHPAPAPAL